MSNEIRGQSRHDAMGSIPVHARQEQKATPVETLAYSIPEFCKAHNISVAHYYVLKQRGLGPVEMQLGRRRLISREAAVAWRAARSVGQSR
jgi:hypothetical protein